jgi:hypothetical protein
VWAALVSRIHSSSLNTGNGYVRILHVELGCLMKIMNFLY